MYVSPFKKVQLGGQPSLQLGGFFWSFLLMVGGGGPCRRFSFWIKTRLSERARILKFKVKTIFFFSFVTKIQSYHIPRRCLQIVSFKQGVISLSEDVDYVLETLLKKSSIWPYALVWSGGPPTEFQTWTGFFPSPPPSLQVRQSIGLLQRSKTYFTPTRFDPFLLTNTYPVATPWPFLGFFSPGWNIPLPIHLFLLWEVKRCRKHGPALPVLPIPSKRGFRILVGWNYSLSFPKSPPPSWVDAGPY